MDKKGVLGKSLSPEEASLKVAEESIVLLRNRGVLPLKPQPIALFGLGAIDTLFGGTGSGYVDPVQNISILEGLEQTGYTVLSKPLLEEELEEQKRLDREDQSISRDDREWNGLRHLLSDPLLTLEDLGPFKGAKVAFYVIRRESGEAKDREAVPGDYYLSENEKANIDLLGRYFGKVVVILNSGIVDVSWYHGLSHCEGLLFMGFCGGEGGLALAHVIAGKVNPSGHLADTWARDYSDYPTSSSFSKKAAQSNQQDYQEGIYVGYRFFDFYPGRSFENFGFGMSYSLFREKLLSMKQVGANLSLVFSLENRGPYPGKEVVQVYVSAPEGRLDKPRKELKGFQKSPLLKVHEKALISIVIPLASLASFNSEESAFVIEKGLYLIRAGFHSRGTPIVSRLQVNHDVIVSLHNDILHPDRPLKEIIPPKRVSRKISSKTPMLLLDESLIPCQDYRTKNKDSLFLPHPTPKSTFYDVYEGKVTLEDFVASLPSPVLARLVMGRQGETPAPSEDRFHHPEIKPLFDPHTSGETTAQYIATLGIPNLFLDDGPAGVHIRGEKATAFPTGMSQASSWNPELIEEMGDALSQDLDHYGVSSLLGPGLNIHRDPLGGRNFEYYSEDPLLSGKMAAAFSRGVEKHSGRHVCVKHFFSNNQEENRLDENNTISVRALREIYLRNFEIAIKEGHPGCLMTCYNRLNGSFVSSNSEAISILLRGEWGYSGLVMTDWYSKSEKGADLMAGTDLLMGGYSADELLKKMASPEATLTREGLETAARAVLRFILSSAETHSFFERLKAQEVHP